MSILRRAAIALVFTSFAIPAAAQPESRRYLFGGPGLVTLGGAPGMTLQGGGAIEGRFPSGLAASVDVNYVMPAVDNWSAGFGVFSPSVSYYVPTRGQLTPFVAGGYSLFFAGGGAAHGLNIGGGIEVAVRRKTSLRIELRDQVLPWGDRNAHFVSLRIGATLR